MPFLSDRHAPIPSEAWPAAETVWDYMRPVHEVKPSDAILCLGSQDTGVARYAAHLWLEGLAPCIVMSGGITHQEDLAATAWGCPTRGFQHSRCRYTAFGTLVALGFANGAGAGS